MNPFSNLFKVNWLAIIAATIAGFMGFSAELAQGSALEEVFV